MILQLLIGFSIGIIIYFIFMIKNSFFQVNEGSIAVLTSFGKIITSKNASENIKTYEPGLHIKMPWHKIKMISTMEQMIELSGEEGGTMTMASDGTLLRIDSKLRFTPLKSNIYSFLFSLEKPLEHIKGLFVCLLHKEIGSFENSKPKSETNSIKLNDQISSYASIRSDRGILHKKILDYCKNKITNNYGIEFNGVDITDILPPDELAEALNAVINAQSEAQRLYALTEAECEQKLLAAQKGISIAKAKAKATEEDIKKITEILEKLQINGTLNLYLERRSCEVFSDSKISYIKRPI
ncbi:MAG: hypothetical protein K2X69_08270 [Silvanigrellaceae bacterium]|nr:hypothetical protein [Silvanigrellaceae bacterium]